MVPLCWNCHDNHDAIECETMKKLELPYTFLIDNFDVVTPLRVLLLFYRYAEQKARDIDDINLKYQIDEMLNMESHCDERRGTWIWNEHAKNVIQPLRDINIDKIFQLVDAPWTLTDDFLQKLCGILDVNTFEVRTQYFEVCFMIEAGEKCHFSYNFSYHLFKLIFFCYIGISGTWFIYTSSTLSS